MISFAQLLENCYVDAASLATAGNSINSNNILIIGSFL